MLKRTSNPLLPLGLLTLAALAVAVPGRGDQLAGMPRAEDAPSFRGSELDQQGPSVLNAQAVRELIDAGQSQRIDIVCLGDSNQLYSAVGWQDGLTNALGELLPMYATPVLGAGQNNAIGIAINTMSNTAFPPSGAPAPLLEFNDPGLGLNATPYGFLPGGSTIPAASSIGMRLRPGNASWPNNNFNAAHALRQHFTYGTLDSAPGAVFQPQLFQSGTFNLTSGPIFPGAGSFGVASGFLDMPAGERNSNDIVFRWFGSGVPDGVGPVHGLYMRMEDLDQPTGQSISTLYGVGGATARDCAVALQGASVDHLRGFFEQIRALQPASKKILIRIAFGANDFLDQVDSVGPDGPFMAGTDAAVADNLRAIIDALNEVWTLAGWDPDELVFLLIAPHNRLAQEPEGYGYREAIADVAMDAPNIAYLNHYRLGERFELLADGMYEFPTGAHLSPEGYVHINRLEIKRIYQQNVSDVNFDCRVDTADLGLLIADFGEAASLTDLNNDRVVDTADLGILLAEFGMVCD